MKMVLRMSVQASLLLSSLTMAMAGSYGITRLPCYGRNSTTDWSDMGIKPHNLTMFFTPSRPGSQRIQVSENGVVFDPHQVFYDHTFVVRDVTEQDDGKFSVLLDGVITAVLTLKVRDCATRVTVLYGNTYNLSLSTPSRHAETLEFTPQWYSDEPPVLLWNRTGDPQALGGHRGRLVDGEWMIERLTQEHGGYYTIRDKDRERAHRTKMIVTAPGLYFHKFNGEDFNLTLDMDPAVLDVSYTHFSHHTPRGPEVPLMERGRMVSGWERAFGGRIWRITTPPGLLQVRINDVQPSDAGLFKIRDQRGNVALEVELDVAPALQVQPTHHTTIHHTTESRLVHGSAESVRLVNGTSMCSGRVEVKSDQSWVSVCEGDFDQQDAEVVCRQLGCGAPSVLRGVFYGDVVNASRWTKEFQCEGSESVLLDCGTSNSTRNTCSSDTTVALTCSGNYTLESEPPTMVPELTCYTGDGMNYRGEVALTTSGKTCQRWSAQRPHKHDRTPENNPHEGLDSNYCRNPDGEKKPWCYTTDSETRWEYCPVPRCDVPPRPELSCYTGDGRNYRGEVALTTSGKTCQRWSAQRPHKHTRTPLKHRHRGLVNNYCRNPDNELMPWCYTTDSQTRWEYCPIPRCDVAPGPEAEPPTMAPELSCYTGDGMNYRGEVAMTTSGKTCQRWSAQRPHKHDRTPENNPHEGLDNNFCRNPDDGKMPWCYTTDSQTRWDYCPVPRCDVAPGPELSCYTGDGRNYRGDLALTTSGKTCQRWSAQRPHKHTRTPENHKHRGLDSNFCRNPDNELMPWCYTTDSQTRWEYCPLPRCDVAPGPEAEPPTMAPELSCYTGDGMNYRGEVASTTSGKTCQRWSAQRPHKHGRTPENNPHEGLDKNYCRNPDGEKKPWCYTTDSETRWEYCPVPRCDVPPRPELSCYTGDGRNYRGEVALTTSGKTCQRWSVQRPHKHTRTPENHMDRGLVNNFCRNPDNELMPWCYTTDSQTRWEYCPIPRCDVAAGPATIVPPELTCYTGDGMNYRGEVARTSSGKTCQRWSAQRPHKHDRTAENNPHEGLDSNYCRNPDGEKKPWCYTTDSETRWEYCPVPRCDVPPSPELSCYTGDGRNYRGEVALTTSGKTCQRWSAQRPHEHTRTPENHMHRGLDNNVCRNPDNELMPWCYTTDSQARWEYCPVPRCDVAPRPELSCYTGDGRNYRGDLAMTTSGKTCQRWSAQRPHKHDRTPENNPHKGLDSNYCRNPDNELMPWCYTTDSETRWEYCPVPRCDVAPEPELTCYTGDGMNYRGEVTRTTSGKTCQRWSAQRPHKHDRTPENNPHEGLDSNYCRNPDSEKKPWCYTTDSETRWEYCPVPRCYAPGLNQN